MGGEEPPRFAETTPPRYPGSSYDFTLQLVVEMQKSIGQLQEAVGTLKEESKHQGEKLDKINLKIYAATAVLVVVGTILSFLVNKGVDLLIQIKDGH